MTRWGLDIISMRACEALVVLYFGVAGFPFWYIYSIVIINDFCAMYGNHSVLIVGNLLRIDVFNIKV